MENPFKSHEDPRKTHRKLMENLSYWKPIGNSWKIYGKPIQNPRKNHGKLVESQRKPMKKPWNTYRKPSQNSWKTYGKLTENPFTTHGNPYWQFQNHWDATELPRRSSFLSARCDHWTLGPGREARSSWMERWFPGSSIGFPLKKWNLTNMFPLKHE